MAEKQAPQNKQITAKDTETKEVPVLREYFVPEYQVTVYATSLNEALAKAKELRDNKDTNI